MWKHLLRCMMQCDTEAKRPLCWLLKLLSVWCTMVWIWHLSPLCIYILHGWKTRSGHPAWNAAQFAQVLSLLAPEKRRMHVPEEEKLKLIVEICKCLPLWPMANMWGLKRLGLMITKGLFLSRAHATCLQHMLFKLRKVFTKPPSCVCIYILSFNSVDAESEMKTSAQAVRRHVDQEQYKQNFEFCIQSRFRMQSYSSSATQIGYRACGKEKVINIKWIPQQPFTRQRRQQFERTKKKGRKRVKCNVALLQGYVCTRAHPCAHAHTRTPVLWVLLHSQVSL